MLPMDNETTLYQKEPSRKVNVAETSCLITSHKNESGSDDAHSGIEIRVKLVSEINADCGANYCIPDINGKENARRGEPSFMEPPFKRRRTPERDANVNVEECTTRQDYNTTNDAEIDVHNSKGCGTFKIKTEPNSEINEDSYNNGVILPSGSKLSTNPADIKPAIKVERADASSISRNSCRFGISCYRRNPMHRMEEAHPGDHDYRRPNFRSPPDGTPDCPYGDLCYRRNPIHFEQFNHPPETDFEKNYKLMLRQRHQQKQLRDDVCNTNAHSSESDDDLNMEDPFSNDEYFDSDYEPNSDDDDDEYDACDRAEE